MTARQKRYEKICNEYVNAFAKKQGLEFDFFVGGIVGDISSFTQQYFFNFNDIVWDMNSDQPKGLITEWYWSSLENPEKAINYYSYSKGLRV